MKIFLYHNELGQYEVIQDNGNGNEVLLGEFLDLECAENKFKEVIRDRVVAAHKKTIVQYQDGVGHVMDHRSGNAVKIAGKEYLGL